MADIIHISEIVTPNAADLRGDDDEIEVRLDRELTDWEEFALSQSRTDVTAVGDVVYFAYAPVNPLPLSGLIDVIKSLPTAAQDLKDQYEAHAAQILHVATQDAPGISVRQARDEG